MDYLLHILVLIGIYVILASSLNLVAGYLGMPSIAHASFYGIGAYAFALASLRFGAAFPIAVAGAAAAAAACALFIGIAFLRIRDDYFAIGTFGFQMVAFSVLNNWVEVTRGPLGLPDIPQPRLLLALGGARIGFLLLSCSIAVVSTAFVYALQSSPLGREMKAIREDEVLSSAAGKDVRRRKTVIFAVAAAMAGIAGAVYASYVSFIDPSSFSVNESIFILSIVIIGGAGVANGPVIGSALLVSLPEVLRLIGLPSGIAANLRQILYGSLLVAFVMLRPRGLVRRSSTVVDAIR